MSLNKHQRHVTSEELKAHFHESTLSIENIAQEMNISIEEVERVLDMDAQMVSLAINCKHLYT